MDTFKIEGFLGKSLIHVGESLDRLSSHLPAHTSPIIITDENVKALYGSSFPKAPVITIGTGERIKTLATVESILKELIRLGCDRSGFIVGIGGGIVCDIAGFAASVYLRGIPFGFVSTTLLSQVDASVGGKNGVNLDAYKNMVGVFNQPAFVICDPDLLRTLPETEISNGMAEIVKHALIADASLFDFIEANWEKALGLDHEIIHRLVADSVRIKSAIVCQDEKETGERRKLNFGHTIGHAVEKLEPVGHGRAVAIGIAAAARFSRSKKQLDPLAVTRIIELLNHLNLPTDLTYGDEDIIRAAGKDKKKQGDRLFFVFLEKIGRARVESIEFEDLHSFLSGDEPNIP